MDEKLELVKKMKDALAKNQANQLKRISNEAIEKAVLTEDKELVDISLVSYALYKLLTKSHYQDSPEWVRLKEEVLECLEECPPGELGRVLEEKIIQKIVKLDEAHGHYTHDLIDKARVKQASRVYAMGVSLETAIG